MKRLSFAGFGAAAGATLVIVGASPALAWQDWKHAGAAGCGASYVVTLSDTSSPLNPADAYRFFREHVTHRSGVKTSRVRSTSGYWTSYHTQTADSRDWYAQWGSILNATSGCG